MIELLRSVVWRLMGYAPGRMPVASDALKQWSDSVLKQVNENVSRQISEQQGRLMEFLRQEHQRDADARLACRQFDVTLALLTGSGAPSQEDIDLVREAAERLIESFR